MSNVKILKTEGKLGGCAYIEGTKLPVWAIIEYLKEDPTRKNILAGFPYLTNEMLDAAIAYAESNKAEIERDYRESQE